MMPETSAATAFSAPERQALLAVKGVGPAVVARLEELGIGGFAELARRDPLDICAMVSAVDGGDLLA